MKTKDTKNIELKKLNSALQLWQKLHDTPEKVAGAHRKVLLERVVQSMSFENQPVDIVRLKALLKKAPTR